MSDKKKLTKKEKEKLSEEEMIEIINSIIPEVQEKWINIGLQTSQDGKLNKRKVNNLIRKLYTNGGYKHPKKIEYVASPFEALFLRTILSHKDSFDKFTEDK